MSTSNSSLHNRVSDDLALLQKLVRLHELVKARKPELKTPNNEEFADLGRRLGSLEKRAKKQGVFTVVLVGKEKQGKSTLLNAWIGKELLPTAKSRCTFVVTEIAAAAQNEEHVEIVFKTDAEFAKDCEDLEDMKKNPEPKVSKPAADELARIEANKSELALYIGKAPKKLPGLSKKDIWEWIANPELMENAFGVANAPARYPAVKKVRVFSSRLGAAENRVLIDTPGYDSVYESHRRMAREAIEEADAFILVSGVYNRNNLTQAEAEILQLIDRTGPTASKAMERGFVCLTQLDSELSREAVQHRQKAIIHDELHGKYQVAPDRVIVVAPLIYLVKEGHSTLPENDEKQLLAGLAMIGGDTGVPTLINKVSQFLQQDLAGLRERDEQDLRKRLGETASPLLLAAREAFPGSTREAEAELAALDDRAWNDWFDVEWKSITNDINHWIYSHHPDKIGMMQPWWEEFAHGVKDLLAQPKAMTSADLTEQLNQSPTEYHVHDTEELEKAERQRLVNFYDRGFDQIADRLAHQAHEHLEELKREIVRRCFGLEGVLGENNVRQQKVASDRFEHEVAGFVKKRVTEALQTNLRWRRYSATRDEIQKKFDGHQSLHSLTNDFNWPTEVELPEWVGAQSNGWEERRVGVVPNFEPAMTLQGGGVKLVLHGSGVDLYSQPKQKDKDEVDHDDCKFVTQQCAGDFSLSVRLESHAQQGKTGLMVRESLERSASRYASLAVAASQELEWLCLEKPKGEMAWNLFEKEPNVALPCWLRLLRRGQQVRGFYSRNGRDWFSLGKPMVFASDKVWLGAFGCSHSHERTTKFVFSYFSLQRGTLWDNQQSLVESVKSDITGDLQRFAVAACAEVFPGKDTWTLLNRLIIGLRNALQADRANIRSLFARQRDRIPSAPKRGAIPRVGFEARQLREELEHALK
ncbi:MAG: hypothetical protein RIS76_2539 [Verrucomicrobiota bacterium]|jgi:GTPase SAR1 family protein/regulation of enolase protein 1 (concanavalin A-like superfamily)